MNDPIKQCCGEVPYIQKIDLAQMKIECPRCGTYWISMDRYKMIRDWNDNVKPQADEKPMVADTTSSSPKSSPVVPPVTEDYMPPITNELEVFFINQRLLKDNHDLINELAQVKEERDRAKQGCDQLRGLYRCAMDECRVLESITSREAYCEAWKKEYDKRANDKELTPTQTTPNIPDDLHRNLNHIPSSACPEVPRASNEKQLTPEEINAFNSKRIAALAERLEKVEKGFASFIKNQQMANNPYFNS